MPHQREDAQTREVAQMKAQARSLVERWDEPGRSLLLEALLDRELANKKASSNRHWALAWDRVRKGLQGRRPETLLPAEWKSMLNDWLTRPDARLGRRTASISAIYVRSTLGRFFPDQRLPQEIDKALRLTRGPIVQGGRVLEDAEFQILLEAAISARTSRKNPTMATMRMALLWTFWDSAMRPNELLSLNVRDVAIAGEVTTLSLQPDAPLLKRGPRQVQGIDMTRPLRVWLEGHPAATTPTAPLFHQADDRTGLQRLSLRSATSWLHQWSNQAGLNPPGSKPLTLRDFRHTRLTRLARNNWHPSKIEALAGWARGSNMSAHYIHTAQSDIKEQLLRDAGLDATGYKQLVDAGRDDLALAQLLHRLLAKANAPHIKQSEAARP